MTYEGAVFPPVALLSAPKGASRPLGRPLVDGDPLLLLLLPLLRPEPLLAWLPEGEDAAEEAGELDEEEAAEIPPLLPLLLLLPWSCPVRIVFCDTSPTHVTTAPTGRQRSVLRMPCLVICHAFSMSTLDRLFWLTSSGTNSDLTSNTERSLPACSAFSTLTRAPPPCTLPSSTNHSHSSKTLRVSNGSYTVRPSARCLRHTSSSTTSFITASLLSLSSHLTGLPLLTRPRMATRAGSATPAKSAIVSTEIAPASSFAFLPWCRESR
mmetsp:Transcript_31186/g.79504  ORF Transcript_31186/g.79504 Transcript_31186/m.79504 type:complete len:267 (+) Transcript_31186:1005-1805(+)